MNALGLAFVTTARLRTVPEERIVDGLVLRGWMRVDRERDPEGPRRVVRDALARWRGLGLPSTRDAQGQHRYDPGEVAIVMRYAGWKGLDPFWREYQLPTLRAYVLSLHPPGTPRDRTPDPRALPPRRVAVSITRRFEPRWIGRNARLRIPAPVHDAAQRDLTIAFDPPQGAPGSMRGAEGYVELPLTEAPVAPVTLGVQYAYVARPSPAPGGPLSLAPAERAQHLSTHEEAIRVTPQVVAAAQALTRGRSDPIERVRALYDHVAGRRCGVAFPYALFDMAPPDGPPQMGWYDCRMVAVHFTALCRALGMPTRRIAGYLLSPDAPAFHHWVEVWIDGRGWFPVDALSGEGSAVLSEPAWIPPLGAIDYRMKIGVVPRVFTGSPGVRMPEHWTRLERAEGEAISTELVDATTLEVVWTDTMRVTLGETVPE
ncbi:MAG: transglutaminase domain-containing protein [Burkholderiales bacterium]|nr:transglutaminase domain-containing protein [Burkholderiales bacterium]